MSAATHTTSSAPEPTSHHPHIIIRYMACAYGRIDVRFRSGPPAPDTGRSFVTVDIPAPPPGEPLSAEVRAAVVEATAALVTRSRMRCCAVFGPTDVVYCELDGTTTSSTVSPSGGVRYDRVKNTVTALTAEEGE